jgi:alpha-D-ribose 1-methylphosphonate 5-triphosphate synthase subunit PhnG
MLCVIGFDVTTLCAIADTLYQRANHNHRCQKSLQAKALKKIWLNLLH